MEYPHNRPYTADDLVRIITLLRDPVNGCPWDKVQTHTSIRMNFLEEAYEAVDALDLDDPVLMCEELGDVLMQVAFHTCMEQETGRFTWEQVCDGVCQKLIERHPNIFGTQPGYEGITDWDALKNKEKGRRTLADDLESVPRAMPALMRAAKLQKTAEQQRVQQRMMRRIRACDHLTQLIRHIVGKRAGKSHAKHRHIAGQNEQERPSRAETFLLSHRARIAAFQQHGKQRRNRPDEQRRRQQRIAKCAKQQHGQLSAPVFAKQVLYFLHAITQ